MPWRWSQHVPPKRLYSYVTRHGATFHSIPHSPLRGKTPIPQTKASFYFTARHFKSQCNLIPSVCSFDRPWRKTRPWDSSRSLCQQHWVQLRVVPSTTWRKWVLYVDVSACGFTWMERTPVGYIHSFCWLSYDRSNPSSKARSPTTAIQCFPFQFPVPSIFLKVIQLLLTSSSSSSRHISNTSSIFTLTIWFRRQFLGNMHDDISETFPSHDK